MSKSETITVRLPVTLHDELDRFYGEDGFHSTLPDLTKVAMYNYYKKTLSIIPIYNKRLEEQIKSRKVIFLGGSKLGAIQRMFVDEVDFGTETIQYSVRIALGFNEALLQLIECTGLFKNRNHFCINALWDYHLELQTSEFVENAIWNKDKEKVESVTEYVENTYVLLYDRIPQPWSEFSKPTEADYQQWLN